MRSYFLLRRFFYVEFMLFTLLPDFYEFADLFLTRPLFDLIVKLLFSVKFLNTFLSD